MQTFNNVFVDFCLPEWFEGPEHLRNTLQAWNKHYAELYEDEGDDDIEEAFQEILEAFRQVNNIVEHKQYVYIAWSLALAARPTLAFYFPDDLRPDTALNTLRSWAESDVEVSSSFAKALFPDWWKGAHTPASEAFAVFGSALTALDKARSHESVRYILDEAITGDALSPYWQAKREIFNWWLIDVVPSAYHLHLSSSLYTSKGILPTSEVVEAIPSVLPSPPKLTSVLTSAARRSLPGDQLR